jgi:hypothetical protein
MKPVDISGRNWDGLLNRRSSGLEEAEASTGQNGDSPLIRAVVLMLGVEELQERVDEIAVRG